MRAWGSDFKHRRTLGHCVSLVCELLSQLFFFMNPLLKSSLEQFCYTDLGVLFESFCSLSWINEAESYWSGPEIPAWRRRRWETAAGPEPPHCGCTCENTPKGPRVSSSIDEVILLKFITFLQINVSVSPSCAWFFDITLKQADV